MSRLRSCLSEDWDAAYENVRTSLKEASDANDAVSNSKIGRTSELREENEALAKAAESITGLGFAYLCTSIGGRRNLPKSVIDGGKKWFVELPEHVSCNESSWIVILILCVERKHEWCVTSPSLSVTLHASLTDINSRRESSSCYFKREVQVRTP
jgi:hypothetical protein